MHNLTISFKCHVMSQFVTDGTDQSLIKPVVEYCVVCGDKASGEQPTLCVCVCVCVFYLISFTGLSLLLTTATVLLLLPRAPLWSGEL